MTPDPDLYYLCRPGPEHAPPAVPVAVVTAADFLADEPACKVLWALIDTQFRTRSKFLAVWRCASFVAVHRAADGAADGLLLISAPVNWQVDYVVVRPESRGQGIAGALVKAAVAAAFRHRVPYVMLTSKPALRPLYEACGFSVVAAAG